MATLKSRGTKLYARVRWYDNHGIQKERQIPLKTSEYATAMERLMEVNKVETAVKNGVVISFPWSNQDGRMKLVKYDLG